MEEQQSMKKPNHPEESSLPHLPPMTKEEKKAL
jgi:hypothetical protein